MNELHYGDCLDFIPTLQRKVDLVYVDIPFYTKQTFRKDGKLCYDDHSTEFIAPFLSSVFQCMWGTASIYVHCDYRLTGVVRNEMDKHFYFRNEIIWSYGSRGGKKGSNQYPRIHNSILFSTKSPNTWTYHQQYIEHLRSSEEARKLGYRKGSDGIWFSVAPRGKYTDKSIERLRLEGRIHDTSTGGIGVKYFFEERKGKMVYNEPVSDVWADISDMWGTSIKERTGYPTQKPLKLMERIIASSSNEGDTVADFFCGSGSFLVTAQNMGRKWIGCDMSAEAIRVTTERLNGIGAQFESTTV